MFGQCPILVYLGLRSILMLCELARMGEYGVLPEYLREIYDRVLTMLDPANRI